VFLVGMNNNIYLRSTKFRAISNLLKRKNQRIKIPLPPSLRVCFHILTFLRASF